MDTTNPIDILKSYLGKTVYCLNMYKIAIPTLLGNIKYGNLALPNDVVYSGTLDAIEETTSRFNIKNNTPDDVAQPLDFQYSPPDIRKLYSYDYLTTSNKDGHVILISNNIFDIKRYFKSKFVNIENDVKHYTSIWEYKTTDILISKTEIIKLQVANEIKTAYKLAQANIK